MNEHAVQTVSPTAASADDVKLIAGYAGPAVLIGGNGKPILSNAKGAGLERALEGAAVADIQVLIDKARESGSIAGATVTISTSRGDLVLDVTAVPVSGGDGGRVLVLARDLTMERNLRTTLVESRQRYKDLVEISNDFSWEVDAEGRFVFVSPKGALGYKPDEMIGRAARDFVIDPDDFTPFPFTTTRRLDNVEMWLTRIDGGTSCMVVTAMPLTRADGDQDSWTGCRGVCRDVTEERESEAALARARHREQLLNYIVNQIRDEIEPHDMLSAAATAMARALGAAGCRIYRNDERGGLAIAAEYGNFKGLDGLQDRLAGLKSSEVRAFDMGSWAVLSTPTHYRSEMNGAIAMWKPAGKGAWDDDHSLLIADVANQLGIANEQIANHERIVRLSRTDGMTGMLNRRAFYEEELPRRVQRLERSGQTAALFYIDMDNFKRVNDVHGHQAGDDAILYLRDMLLNFSRPGDLIARLGGDEFAMWLDGIDEETVKRRAAQLIETSAEMRKMSGDESHPLGISVGIAFFDPGTGEKLNELLARSDAAMYAVKKKSKGGFGMAPPPGAKPDSED